MHKSFSFLRSAVVSPKTLPGNIEANTDIIIDSIKEANSKGAGIILFPELAITGYTLGDLFHSDTTKKRTEESLIKIAEVTKHIDAICIVGAPVVSGGVLLNAGVVFSKGAPIAVIPKLHLPNYKEFYEKRWFTSGYDNVRTTAKIGEWEVPCGAFTIIEDKNHPEISIGIEVCEDVWMPIPPSSIHALMGATILCNLSASNELVGKASYRRELVTTQSAHTVSAYLYASSGVGESTTDVVFSGHNIITENGTLLAETKRFSRETEIIYADIDIDHLTLDRARTNSFSDNHRLLGTMPTYTTLTTNIPLYTGSELFRNIKQTPFLPENIEKRAEVCKEIFSIQTSALAKRMDSTGLQKIVLGLSGGLDSTLALLVAIETFDLLKINRKNILCYTMPGYGTSDRTKNNAFTLAECAGVSIEEIPIGETVAMHFKDISHEKNNEDVVFENAQARYRTMILMDKANQQGAIVLGTGDLSESALGWCTFNGDHIAHYNINIGIPKTLVKYVVAYVASAQGGELEKVLNDIVDTPVSPELKSTNTDGTIAQVTEDVVGPYILHDFFLYHFVRWGGSPEKILFLAKIAFDGSYDEATIKKWLGMFVRRFFQNQWKRSVATDGPKVGSVSLSPRGDWRMPSDADMTEWIAMFK